MNNIIYIFNIHDEKENNTINELKVKLLRLFYSLITANAFLDEKITIFCDFDTMYILSLLPFEFELCLIKKNAIIEINKYNNDILLVSENCYFKINDNFENIKKRNGILYKNKRRKLKYREIEIVFNRVLVDINENDMINDIKLISNDLYEKFNNKLQFVINYIMNPNNK